MKQVIGGKVYYARSFLIRGNGANIDREAVKKWEARKRVDCIKDRGETWYCYDTIPQESRQKIDSCESMQMLQELALSYNEEFTQYLAPLSKAGVRQAAREAKARDWALWARISQLTDKGNPGRITVREVFTLYSGLGLRKRLKHETRFYRKLQEFNRDPLACIIDARVGKKGGATKKTARHLEVLETLYSLPNKYKIPFITDEANAIFQKEGLKTLSMESVKKILADKQLRARTYLSRHGGKAHSDNHRAYLPFEKALAVGIRAEMDGVKLPFKVWDKEGKKLVRPWMFAIIDTHSGKITGWSLDYSETRWLVVQALKSQAKNGWLPKEIWTDNFSGKDTPEFDDLEEKLCGLGSVIKYCKPGKSQEKPFIERFFGTFQDRFCREYGDWLGMAVTSKNLNNRPNPDALKAYTKQHGFPTMQQVEERIEAMLVKYHATSFDRKPTANELFEACKEPQTVAITEMELPYLFWHKTAAKVNRGLLRIEVNKQEYIYKAGVEFNGQTLVVRYEPEDLSEVYLFTDDEAETHLGVLQQHGLINRNTIKDIGSADRLNRKEREAEEAKALALAAPHMTAKEILSLAEDEEEDQILAFASVPERQESRKRGNPFTTPGTLKVWNPNETE